MFDYRAGTKNIQGEHGTSYSATMKRSPREEGRKEGWKERRKEGGGEGGIKREGKEMELSKTES